jgi:iron complex outermembrane receptor protein
MEGQQVTVPIAPLNTQTLRNVGNADIYGIEFNTTYRTPVRGLTLNAAFAWNHARYVQYIAACYTGQRSPACANRFNPQTGEITLSQDLGGSQVTRAPDGTGNAGFVYETPISARFKVDLSGNVSYSSSYFTSADNRPTGQQAAYALYDASVTLSPIEDKWSLVLIGRNLSNEFYITRTVGRSFTGTAAGTPTSQPPDVVGVVSRGREMWLRFTVNFRP